MVAALREVAPDFGRSTEALLRHVAAMGSSREVVIAQFLADLGTFSGGDLDVILDDYHLVEDSMDVRMIVSRLLERAPDGMRFILVGRSRPNLALGRLLAQDRVFELTIDDLRFTKAEIAELFSTTYHQPLDPEACSVIAERTEGWAASLQLVSASIAVSRPSEISSFIKALSGATGPIYDFLAEEVLTRLSAQTQRVLIHASLLDHVRPELVSAALSVLDDAPGDDAVDVALGAAESLGLLGGRHSSNARIHPLFRDFLAHHLGIEASPGQIRAMHRAIAEAAESDDWIAAAKHYALADEPEEGMRVLGSAASEALGTGAWGAAVEIVGLMSDATPPPSVEVIKARALISEGRSDDAIALLESISSPNLDSDESALVGLTRASALQMGGQGKALWQEVGSLRASRHSDPVVNRVAEAWALIGTACSGGSISDARQSLDTLAREAGAQGLGHFEGIALHNSATAALAQGDYGAAVQLAGRACNTLVDSPADASVRPSTLMTKGVAMVESGEFEGGLAMVDQATAAEDAQPDVIADATYLASIFGDNHRADALWYRLRRLMLSGPTPVGTPHQAAVVRVTTLISMGRHAAAMAETKALESEPSGDLDGLSRGSYLIALAAVLTSKATAEDQVEEALAATDRQNAWRWEYRLRVLASASCGDAAGLSHWVGVCSNASSLVVLEMADLLGMHLGLFDAVPDAIAQSVARHPTRWRPILLRQLEQSSHLNAEVAARLLTEYGVREDANRLAEYERHCSSTRKKAKVQFSRTLVRRVSPTLRVHDLGRTTYEVSGVEVRASASRRKALSLLLFLVTRPKQTATRDMVMEELWPNQTPSSAVNSLHQTLHFVRRDIAPWNEGGASADYVPLDSELIYLDPDLVQVDSVAFLRQATKALGGPNLARTGPSISRLYSGRFAPEFEYEDWAEDWRALVHAKYLLLSQATAAALIKAQRTHHAIEVLSRAVGIDGMAFDLRAALIRALASAGATDAAAEHYRRYSHLLQRELEVRAPPMHELIRGEGDDSVES